MSTDTRGRNFKKWLETLSSLNLSTLISLSCINRPNYPICLMCRHLKILSRHPNTIFDQPFFCQPPSFVCCDPNCRIIGMAKKWMMTPLNTLPIEKHIFLCPNVFESGIPEEKEEEGHFIHHLSHFLWFTKQKISTFWKYFQFITYICSC